jgi:hypothetical protein
MWIEGDRLQVIDSALEGSRRDDVDRLLADILKSGAGQGQIPTTCPTCRRDLVRNALPGVGLYVSACPDRHGAWMTSDVVETLRRFVGEHATLAAKKRHQLRLLNRLLVVFGVVTLAAVPLTYPERTMMMIVGAADSFYNNRVSETYWPSRGWLYKTAIPTKNSSIDVHDELLYFHRLLTLLDDGITNRLNIDGVLQTRRSETEYGALYDVYRGKQLVVLEQLRRKDAPDQLKPIHARVITATEQQIEFYRAFVDAKLKDPSMDLGRMLGDPALRRANQELLTAWAEIRRLYPNLDVETSEAIERHLCGFDII